MAGTTIRVPNPSPTLDKNLASMGLGILSSIGVGVWSKAPEAFPDSNTTLDTFQSASIIFRPSLTASDFRKFGHHASTNDCHFHSLGIKRTQISGKERLFQKSRVKSHNFSTIFISE